MAKVLMFISFVVFMAFVGGMSSDEPTWLRVYCLPAVGALFGVWIIFLQKGNLQSQEAMIFIGSCVNCGLLMGLRADCASRWERGLVGATALTLRGHRKITCAILRRIFACL